MADSFSKTIFRNVIFCYFRKLLEFGFVAHSGEAKNDGDILNLLKIYVCR